MGLASSPTYAKKKRKNGARVVLVSDILKSGWIQLELEVAKRTDSELTEIILPVDHSTPFISVQVTFKLPGFLVGQWLISEKTNEKPLSRRNPGFFTGTFIMTCARSGTFEISGTISGTGLACMASLSFLSRGSGGRSALYI
jgi:hypothetical protein